MGKRTDALLPGVDSVIHSRRNKCLLSPTGVYADIHRRGGIRLPLESRIAGVCKEALEVTKTSQLGPRPGGVRMDQGSI